MWITKLLISPVKKGFFAPKRPNLAQNWHFWSIWARPCRLIWCPVGGSVGGCGARAVSRKTPIYFIGIDHKVVQILEKYSLFFISTLILSSLGQVSSVVGRGHTSSPLAADITHRPVERVLRTMLTMLERVLQTLKARGLNKQTDKVIGRWYIGSV